MPTTNPKKYVSHSVCLNVCTNCNLKCSWCYKQACYKNQILSFSQFKRFYRCIIQRNVDTVILIGGEPTVHPEFLQIIKLLADKKIILNTNGLMFSDKEFLSDCAKYKKQSARYLDKLSGLNSISLSLKGYNEESFFSTTGVHGFERLCQALQNLEQFDIPVTYSYNYSDDMTEQQINEFISFLLEYNINGILINDIRPYYKKDGGIVNSITIKSIESFVEKLDGSGITVYLRLNNPLCEYSMTLIDYVINNHRLISKCAVRSSSGYFFSPLLELIPCNELTEVILGRFDLDFNNFMELEKLWNMHHIRRFYEKLSGYPDIKCKQCRLWRICGGSCILHWLNKEDS